eukprot:gene15834-21454_t
MLRKSISYDAQDHTTRSSIVKGNTMQEFSSKFDYVLVFKMGKDGSQSPYAKESVHAIINAGLEVFTYLSIQGDELFVMVYCPDNVLEDFAQGIEYDMLADPQKLEEDLSKMNVSIAHNPLVTDKKPYELIFLNYKKDMRHLYQVPAGDDTPFSKLHRLKLIANLIQAPQIDGGCNLQITKMLLRKRLLAMFALHDRKVTSQLLDQIWEKSRMPWNIPVYDLKQYFGEKIALYYVFLGHYSLWLVGPSLISFTFQLVVWGTQNYSHPVLPFFGVVIMAWSILMLEFWKRRESLTSLEWGMSTYEKEELPRPEFKGKVVKSYINGKDIIFDPPSRRTSRQALTSSAVSTFLMLVIAVVGSIYYMRFALASKLGSNTSIIASVLNAVQIQVFNMLYQILAVKLTNNENHRTDTQYEDSMIIKMFVFQFINSYISFFFLAFIAPFLERPSGVSTDFKGQCAATSCMIPLSLNLAIIFGVRLTITNFINILIPYIMYRLKEKEETKGTEGKEFTPAETDYLLMNYNVLQESIQIYIDSAIQYGFTILFITALPIAVFCSLINNYAKAKFELWKLISFYQRPIPNGAQDIGQWQDIFNVVSIAGVVCNGAIICFTMSVLDGHVSQFGRMWVFIGFQWVLISLQLFIQFLIPDTPIEVEVQLERFEFINEKVIEKVAEDEVEKKDDDNEEEAEGEGLINVIDSEVVTKGCCGRKKKPKNKKADFASDKIDLPVGNYPFTKMASLWPQTIDKNNVNNYRQVPKADAASNQA